MSGKGSTPRPFDVPREQYENNFEGIFGKRERKEWTPPPLPQPKEQADTVYHIPESKLGPFGVPLEQFFPKEKGHYERYEWTITSKEPPCPAD